MFKFWVNQPPILVLVAVVVVVVKNVELNTVKWIFHRIGSRLKWATKNIIYTGVGRVLDDNCQNSMPPIPMLERLDIPPKGYF